MYIFQIHFDRSYSLITAAVIWAFSRENLSTEICEQQRRRPACASAQTDQCFCYSILESNKSNLNAREISIFLLVSAAEETGLCLTLSETPKPGFLATRPIYILILQPKKSEKEVVRTESQEFVNMTDLELSFVINEVRLDYLLLFGLMFYIPVNSYMVMLRQSVLDRDRTDDLWIYSQACYRLRYRTRCLYD